MSLKMKNPDEPHTYTPMAPPPYSPPRPSLGPTVVQPVPGTVIHPGTTTVIHGPGVMTVRPPRVTAVVVPNVMSPNPAGFSCPSCNQEVVTRVEYKPSTRTHLYAALLCVVGCWPLVCLPYFMGSCNNADHYCMNCNAYIGSFRG